MPRIALICSCNAVSRRNVRAGEGVKAVANAPRHEPESCVHTRDQYEFAGAEEAGSKTSGPKAHLVGAVAQSSAPLALVHAASDVDEHLRDDVKPGPAHGEPDEEVVVFQ